mgnify:CR=1 FL=1
MEQTVTCPNCGYTFRVAKETFEKYREGISLSKHQMTDGEAILLDCVKCARVLKISIRTWNVVGDGPAQHERGYQWTGVADDRPRLVGDEYSAPSAGDASDRPAGPAGIIRITEYGRVEKPLPEMGIGAALGFLFFALLPLAALVAEPLIAARAALPGYTAPLPTVPAMALPTAAPAAEKEEKPAPEADEPRLLTPVKEPTFVSEKFRKMLNDHTKQIEGVEKPAGTAPKGK